MGRETARHGGSPAPSREEILAATLAIQARWDEKTRAKREVCKPTPFAFPELSLREFTQDPKGGEAIWTL